jgi:hypothetical protein
MDALSKKLVIHFDSHDGENSLIPYSCFVQALSSLQSAINIIGDFTNENKTFRKSNKPFFSCFIKAFSKGSLISEIVMKQRPDELYMPSIDKSVESFFTYASCVNDDQKTKDLIQKFALNGNAKQLYPFYSAVKTLIPSRGDKSTIEIFNEENPSDKIVYSEKDQKNIHLILDSSVDKSEDVTTIAAKVKRISFSSQMVQFEYSGEEYKKSFSCKYDIENETFLIDNRRKFIQITGIFKYNDKMMPEAILQIKTLDQLDTSPIEMEEFSFNDTHFTFINQPYQFQVTLDESQQYFKIDEPALNVYVFATNREDLREELIESLYADWVDIALADDSNLTEAAKKLKTTLRNMISES